MFLIIYGVNVGANNVNNDPSYSLPQYYESVSGVSKITVVSFTSLEPSNAYQ